MAAPSLLLITGIPACGKSNFTRWLAAVHDYLRFPTGDEPNSDPSAFLAELDRALEGNDKVVMDWGIPAGALTWADQEVVKKRGFTGWWFDGDRVASLQKFEERRAKGEHEAELRHFYLYMYQVEEYWHQYQALCGGRRLDVILPGPSLLSNEVRLAAISR
jgi:hypothetical protein